MNDEQATLDFTIRLAREAGAVIKSYFGTELTRHIKSHEEDFATEADYASEKLILDALAERYLNDAVISEEAGRREGSSDFTWIVDPLDGTRNFANGKSAFGVMIARTKGDEIQISVVYNPVKDLLAHAVRGKGAFLNNRRVITETITRWDKVAPLITGLPAGSREEQMQTFRERLIEAGIQRTTKSAAVNALYALQGRDLEVLVRPGQLWDFAPRALLVAESGLRVTNFWNKPFSWQNDDPGFIAATPELHRKIFEMLDGQTAS